jgi:hypothetical protein
LQHRSVWASIFVGLTWLGVRTLKVNVSQRFWFQLAATTAVSLMVVSMLAGAENIERVLSVVRTNLDEIQRQDSTWNWRVEGFAEVTDRVFSSDTFDMLFGPPSGKDTEFRLTATHLASVGIHSRYFDMLGHYGVFGLIVLMMWLSAVSHRISGWFSQRVGESHETRVGTVFLQALLLSQVTYFVAYIGGAMQGAITALIWLAASRQVPAYKTVFSAAQTNPRQTCPPAQANR